MRFRVASHSRAFAALMGILLLCSLAAATYAAVSNQSAGKRPRQPQFIRFDPKTHKGDTGRISVSVKGESSIILTNAAGDIVSLTSKTDQLIAPVGTYKWEVCYVRVRDSKSGKMSQLVSRPPAGKTPRISVRKGSTTKLAMGLPLSASVAVKSVGPSRVQMDLNLVGRGGERCTIRHINRSDKPQFKVLNSSGRVVWTGSFEYG